MIGGNVQFKRQVNFSDPQYAFDICDFTLHLCDQIVGSCNSACIQHGSKCAGQSSGDRSNHEVKRCQVFRAADFAQAVDTVAGVLEINGKGHSVSLHTADEQRAMRLGLTLPVCRVIVNQAHCFATGGSFDNGLPFSLSMGCGTWGGNNISDNMNYRHYLNTTRISTTIPVDQPTLEEIFGDYWRKFGIEPDAGDA